MSKKWTKFKNQRFLNFINFFFSLEKEKLTKIINSCKKAIIVLITSMIVFDQYNYLIKL